MKLLAVVAIAVLVPALLVGVHVYVWRRLFRDTGTSRRWRRAGVVVVSALGASSLLAMVLTNAVGPRGTEWIAWPGFLWMAMLLYVVLALAALEVPRLVALRALRRRARGDQEPPAGGADAPEPVPAAAGAPAGTRSGATSSTTSGPPAGGPGGTPEDTPANAPAETSAGTPAQTPAGALAGSAAPAPAAASAPGATAPAPAPARPLDPSRRLVLARSVALLASTAAAGTVGYGMTQALGAPRVVRVQIPLARLDRRLDGFRIAVASDIHLGPLLGRAHTRRVVDTLNRTSPDLVAIVGDLADGTAGELGDDATPLRDLTSRHGAFFVTGNHDYMSGADDWIERLAELRVRTLRNEGVPIEHGAAAFDLAGVNDVSGEDHHDGPDFAKALRERDPARPVVLLAHQPVQIHDAADHGVDLQLSGHTHGGQVFPGNFVARLANPAVAGLSRFDDTWLYVTRGAGFWGPPVRVGAPPDVTVVELRATSA